MILAVGALPIVKSFAPDLSDGAKDSGGQGTLMPQ
jgi:hypothetical protein